MFYSESLLAREGPLAQVWLAANLEKKLSKHQFLQSDITTSTQAIMKATAQDENSEALALRLSGQLLYGVVRIYSRKAKYLLDDVSDALLKLKSSFKSNSNTVTLPVNATIVPSVSQLLLQDTITQSDLLYQEPLVFDGTNSTQRPSYSNFFAGTQTNTTQDFDDSIEINRNRFDDLDELNPDDDLDLDLNFEIDEDNRNTEVDASIELGRARDDADLSTILGNRQEDNGFDDINLGPDMDLGFDLDIVPEINEELEQPPTPPSDPLPLPKKQRKSRISTAGQRKIVNDREIEIPVSSFSNTEGIINTNKRSNIPDFKSKRAYIASLLENEFLQNENTQKLLNYKRQKLLDTEIEPEIADDLPELEHSEIENHGYGQDHEIDQGIDMDMGFDFDYDRVPINNQLNDQDSEGPIDEDLDEQNFDDFNSSTIKDGISESTIKVSVHLRNVFKTKKDTTFSEVVEKDIESDEPLSNLPKSEATRVFFELLVLGTGDALKLKQDELFGEIQIQSKENLFSKFV